MFEKPSIVLSVTSVGQANAISCSPLLWRNSNHVSILGAMHLFVPEKSFPGRHEKVIAFSYCAGVYSVSSLFSVCVKSYYRIFIYVANFALSTKFHRIRSSNILDPLRGLSYFPIIVFDVSTNLENCEK